jgi:hypothetical protein
MQQKQSQGNMKPGQKIRTGKFNVGVAAGELLVCRLARCCMRPVWF